MKRGELKYMAIIVDKDNEYGVRIIGDGGEEPGKGVLQVLSGGPMTTASFGRATVGLASVAILRTLGTSLASGAVLGFGGGFISVTSIVGIGATGAGLGFDYVLPVELNGVMRGIPLMSLLSITGAAAF